MAIFDRFRDEISRNRGGPFSVCIDWDAVRDSAGSDFNDVYHSALETRYETGRKEAREAEPFLRAYSGRN